MPNLHFFVQMRIKFNSHFGWKMVRIKGLIGDNRCVNSIQDKL